MSAQKRRHKWSAETETATDVDAARFSRCLICGLKRLRATGLGDQYAFAAEIVYKRRTSVPPCQPRSENP